MQIFSLTFVKIKGPGDHLYSRNGFSMNGFGIIRSLEVHMNPIIWLEKKIFQFNTKAGVKTEK